MKIRVMIIFISITFFVGLAYGDEYDEYGGLLEAATEMEDYMSDMSGSSKVTNSDFNNEVTVRDSNIGKETSVNYGIKVQSEEVSNSKFNNRVNVRNSNVKAGAYVNYGIDIGTK